VLIGKFGGDKNMHREKNFRGGDLKVYKSVTPGGSGSSKLVVRNGKKTPERKVVRRPGGENNQNQGKKTWMKQGRGK